MKLKKNVALSESGFIFNPATGDSYCVNQLASDVLGMLKDDKSLAEVKSEIQDKYEVSASSLDEDLYDLTTHLQQLGLLDCE